MCTSTDIIYNLPYPSSKFFVAVAVSALKTEREHMVSHLQFSGEEDCDYI